MIPLSNINSPGKVTFFHNKLTRGRNSWPFQRAPIAVPKNPAYLGMCFSVNVDACRGKG